MNHLAFSVDNVQCALPLTTVRVVIRMVQPDASPDPHPGRAGMLNFHGEQIPVWSVRSFFGLPERPPRLTDQLIIAEGSRGSAALWVDEVHMIRMDPLPPAEAEKLKIARPLSPGVGMTGDGIVLFSDLFLYLSQEPLVVLMDAQGTARSGIRTGEGR